MLRQNILMNDENSQKPIEGADYPEPRFPFLDQAGNPVLIRRFVKGGLFAAVLVPVIFWLRFREVGWFGWSFTIFLVVMCELFALGDKELLSAPRESALSSLYVRCRHHPFCRFAAF